MRERLDATHYPRFSDLKDRVITPAVKDINTFTDLSVKVEYEKTGRSITHIIFSMKDLCGASAPLSVKEAHRRYYNVERAVDPEQMERLDAFSDYEY